MIHQTPWFERKFEKIEDLGLFPTVFERLQGTPYRLVQKLENVDNSITQPSEEGKWSINKEIGHLFDLEPLWYGRVEDLLNGQTYLRDADLLNTKTHKADHDHSTAQKIIEKFERERHKLIQLLKVVEEKDLKKTALHPRLKTLMTLVDLIYFVAEHDDHHLSRISGLLNKSAV